VIDGNAKNAAVIVERNPFDQVSPGPELVDNAADFPTVSASVVGLDLNRSNSSNTTSGITMVCSLNVNRARGECNRTFVSST
jgi:hypothetical protein